MSNTIGFFEIIDDLVSKGWTSDEAIEKLVKDSLNGNLSPVNVTLNSAADWKAVAEVMKEKYDKKQKS